MTVRIALVSSVVFALSAGVASAAVLAKDPYLTSGPPSGYVVNASLNNSGNAGNVTFGYATGAYGGGTGTTQFTVTAGSLSSNALTDVAGGKVSWLGLGAGSAGTRTTGRSLSPSILTTPAVYYTAQLINRGSNIAGYTPAAGAFVGTGFANNATPTTSGSTNGTEFGYFVGFAGTGVAGDLGSIVIRARAGSTAAGIADTVVLDGSVTSTENSTFLVITKAQPNYTGGTTDRIDYWINPSDTSSEPAMTSSALAAGGFDFFGLQGTSDLLRQLYVSTGANDATGTNSFRNTAFFDEMRLGTDLASVVPEPTSIAAIAGLGLAAVRRRRA